MQIMLININEIDVKKWMSLIIPKGMKLTGQVY